MNRHNTKQSRAKLDALRIETLADVLPHGSGINSDWTFQRCKNGTIYARNSYHGMDENGGYNGWADFTIRIFAHHVAITAPLRSQSADGKRQVVHAVGDLDFEVRFHEPPRRRSWYAGLRDYLQDTIYHAVSPLGIGTINGEIIAQ